jgi:hypothetical protein
MNVAQKNPLEIAIAAVESCTRHGGLTDYQGYLAKIASLRGGETRVDDRAYLDHALRLLINAGYMRRHHVCAGKLAYGPTPAWKDRDELLAPLSTASRPSAPGAYARREEAGGECRAAEGSR